MDQNSERSRLQSLIDEAWGRYTAKKNRIEEFQHDLDRLNKAKEAVSDQKKAMKRLNQDEWDVYNAPRTWKGATHQDLINRGDDIVEKNDVYKKNYIDAVLDALNLETTQLENKIMKEFGFLGDIAATINGWVNQLENLLN